MRVLLRVLPLCLVLIGCATGPTGPERPFAGKTAPAYTAFERGDYRTAAQLFSEMAKKATHPLRADYQLMAARSLIELELPGQARSLLDMIATETLQPQQQTELQLVKARLALKQRDAEQVLSILGSPIAPSFPIRLAAEYHELRAEAYRLQNNYMEASRELVLRERFLDDPDKITANQTKIWESLANLSGRVLVGMQTAPAPDTLSGWVELVRLAKTRAANETDVRERLANWERRYPNHPALPMFRELVVRRGEQMLERPREIAVLLPLTGKFAAPAKAIRDGIFYAYYQQKDRAGFQIRVYDVGPNANNVLASYDQAVANGAQFVIGPLRKEAVDILSQRGDLAVPTLALNYAEEPTAAPVNLYEFSLAPEEEARQAAERAWLDGRTNGAAIVPTGTWGERILTAFEQRWKQLGGKTVASMSYAPSQHDYSAKLKRLLNLDQSYARYKAVSHMVRGDLGFQPRRRQDVDFIFLTAFAPQGRLLRPQLKFYHASRVPVYSTSHVFTGKAKPEIDRDMDGVMFEDMPWTLKGEYPDSLDYQGSLQRLVAMGVDAYDLIPSLPILAQYPHERYQGVTGSLRVDDHHRVHCQLLWAKFRHGEPVVLEGDTGSR